MEGDKGEIGGGIGASGIGAGGIGARGSRKDKGLNSDKHEAAAKRKARPNPPQQDGIPQPTLEVFADGSKLLFDWRQIHPTLLCHIIVQIKDICWALVLGRILQFAYNKDRDNVNQHKDLDIDGFANKVKSKNNEKANTKVSESSMAVGSLKHAMNHVREVGIEKMKDTRKKKPKTFTVKGSFLPVKSATPETIIHLMHTKGLIGMTLDLTLYLMDLKNGIYRVPKPVDGMKRHVVLIVAHGLTLSGEVFFVVQNTWGTKWGVNGYGRIIITSTDDIFYLDELFEKQK